MSTNLDEKELKISALTQRLAEVVAEYETKVADLRVAFTVVSERNKELEEAASVQKSSTEALPAD